jgi:hypothetical protein
MFTLTIACSIGILIGLHYKVLVMVPVTLLVISVSCLSAAMHGSSFFGIFSSAVIATFSVQGGYMIGLTARGLVAHVFRDPAPESKRV